jgi:hypothetical protein
MKGTVDPHYMRRDSIGPLTNLTYLSQADASF